MLACSGPYKSNNSTAYDQSYSSGESDDGKYKGRKPIPIDWNKFGYLYEKWKAGAITAVWFQKEMGLQANTFYRRLREYEQGMCLMNL